jgi:hypothetical protein
MSVSKEWAHGFMPPTERDTVIVARVAFQMDAFAGRL